jgi:hypothetical protein
MRQKCFKSVTILACVASWAGGQTLIDLRTQSKSVDFSGANSTRPIKTGTTLPAVCSVGEMFFKSDAAPGVNLYACTAQNSWTVASGGGSSQPISLAGDVNGPAAANVVTQLQGRSVSSFAPSQGQALAWNAVSARWEPQTIAGGAGGGQTTQLADFAMAQTDSATLTIGPACSLATPCNARFGSAIYSFTSGATATISAGTGAAYIYISSSGTLTVGHSMTVACSSGCVAQNGIGAFPADSIPLGTWSATNGTWDTGGGLDRRAFQSSKSVLPGLGMISAESSGATIVSVDTAQVGLRAAPPPTSTSLCTAGSWATDGTFLYVCVSTNLWRRSPLTIF